MRYRVTTGRIPNDARLRLILGVGERAVVPEEYGENVIFLVSQPRSGSTMLQRMLGRHTDIATRGEPWLMMIPLEMISEAGNDSPVAAHTGRKALQSFLQSIPEGRKDYIEAVRRMNGYLYSRVSSVDGKRYFLDKTPRYYDVIDEIAEVFPRARFILLFRNPLAVLCSIVRTWVKSDWLKLYAFRRDLMDAPSLLLEAKQRYPERAVVVHYEQLVRKPVEELRRICAELDIEFDPGMLSGEKSEGTWLLGDPVNAHSLEKPSKVVAEAWMRDLENPFVWSIVGDYLDMLGEETVEALGYPRATLADSLGAPSYGRMTKVLTPRLYWLLQRPKLERGRGARVYVRVLDAVYRKGLAGCAGSAWGRLFRLRATEGTRL